MRRTITSKMGRIHRNIWRRTLCVWGGVCVGGVRWGVCVGVEYIHTFGLRAWGKCQLERLVSVLVWSECDFVVVPTLLRPPHSSPPAQQAIPIEVKGHRTEYRWCIGISIWLTMSKVLLWVKKFFGLNQRNLSTMSSQRRDSRKISSRACTYKNIIVITTNDIDYLSIIIIISWQMYIHTAYIDLYTIILLAVYIYNYSY